MSFPSVAAVENSVSATDLTSHTVDLPTGIQSGDLLVVWFVCDQNPLITWPSGWTVLQNENNGNVTRSSLGVRVADGTEGSTITITTDAVQQSAHWSARISQWYGNLTDGVASNIYGDEALSISTTPDPQSLDPANWGAEDTLWIALHGHDHGNRTQSAIPANYTNGEYIASTGTFGCALGVARRELNASSEDPGTFTISSSEEWVSATLAIRPSAASQFNKTGGNTSAGSLGGPRTIVHSKSGGISSAGTLSSPTGTFQARSGGNTSALRLGGVRTHRHEVQRVMISTLRMGGGGSIAQPSTGGFTSPAKLGGTHPEMRLGSFVSTSRLGGTGVQLFIFPRVGGTISVSRLGGAQKLSTFGPWSVSRSVIVGAVVGKDGGISTPGSLGGVVAITRAKSGGSTSAVATGAPRSLTYGKPGGLVSSGVLGGTKAYTALKTTGIRSVFRLGGPQAAPTVFNKTGGFVAEPISEASKTVAFVKTAGSVAPVRLGGIPLLAQARSGGIVSPARVGGTKAFTALKPAGIRSPVSTGASKALSLPRSGGFASTGRAGAINQRFQFFGRTGGAISPTRVGGVRTTTYLKTNGALSPVKIGGGGELRSTLFGRLVSAASTGASVNTAISRTGGITAVSKMGGARLSFLKSGGSVSITRLGGTVGLGRTIPAGTGKTGLVGAGHPDKTLVGA